VTEPKNSSNDQAYGVPRGPLATPLFALKLWGRHLPALTGVALVPALAQLVVEIAIITYFGDDTTAVEEWLLVATAAAGLITLPLGYGSIAASFLLLDARVRGVDAGVTWLRFLGRGIKLFGRMFGIFFLMSLALLVPLVPAAVLFKLDLIPAAIPLAAIAAAFDIWLVVRWSVAAPAASIEGLTFSVAFTRSKQLVRQSWWIAFDTLFVFALISGLIWYAFSAISISTLVGAGAAAAHVETNFLINLTSSVPLSCAVFALYAALRHHRG
jgi:hypothetical protein